MKKIETIIISIFAIFTICFFAPLNFVIPNYSQLDIVLSDTIKTYFLISITASFLLSLITFIPYKKVLKILSSIMFSAGIFVYAEMLFIMPHIGKLDGRSFDLKSYIPLCTVEIIFIAVLIFALIKTFKKENFTNLLYKISLFLIILQLCCFIPKFYSLSKIQDISENSIYSFKRYSVNLDNYNEFSSKQNVIVVLMDAFGRGIFEEFMTKNPQYKPLFKDFEYYPNMLSAGGCTSIAVPTMFTGKRIDTTPDTDDYYKQLQELFSKKQALLNSLKAHGFENNIYPFSKNVFFLSTKYIDNLKDSSNTKKYNKQYKQFIKNTISFYSLPLFAKKSSYKYFTDITIGKKRLNFTQEKHYIENAFYKNFNDKIKLKDKEKVFKYYHLRGIHTPYLLNEKFEIKEMSEKDNSDLIEYTVKLYMVMLDQFLTRLKEAGIYDNSAIIIMSDHGTGIYTSPLQSEKESVFNALFMYKGFNEHHDKMQVIDTVWPELEDFENLIKYSAGINDKKWDIKNESQNRKILQEHRENVKNIELKKQDFNYVIFEEKPAQIYKQKQSAKNLGMVVSAKEKLNGVTQYVVLERNNDKYVMQFPNKEYSLGSKTFHNFNIIANNVPAGTYDLKLLIKNKEGKFIQLKLPQSKITVDKNINLTE